MTVIVLSISVISFVIANQWGIWGLFLQRRKLWLRDMKWCNQDHRQINGVFCLLSYPPWFFSNCTLFYNYLIIRLRYYLEYKIIFTKLRERNQVNVKRQNLGGPMWGLRYGGTQWILSVKKYIEGHIPGDMIISFLNNLGQSSSN